MIRTRDYPRKPLLHAQNRNESIQDVLEHEQPQNWCKEISQGSFCIDNGRRVPAAPRPPAAYTARGRSACGPLWCTDCPRSPPTRPQTAAAPAPRTCLQAPAQVSRWPWSAGGGRGARQRRNMRLAGRASTRRSRHRSAHTHTWMQILDKQTRGAEFNAAGQSHDGVLIYTFAQEIVICT